MSCGPEVGFWEGAGQESQDPVCSQEWEVVWVGHFHYTGAPNPQRQPQESASCRSPARSPPPLWPPSPPPTQAVGGVGEAPGK